MKIRNKRKKNNIIKDVVRFRKEKLDHCGDCKFFFNSTCDLRPCKVYKNNISCCDFEDVQK